MEPVDKKFHTPMAKAKGLGAAHSGVLHWWYQRVTAVALVFLLPWFVISLFCSMLSPEVAHVAAWFAKPYNALGMVVLVVMMCWHGKLGLQVVVEDYIHAPWCKYFLLLANQFIAFAAMVLGVIAVLRLHFIDIMSFPV